MSTKKRFNDDRVLLEETLDLINKAREAFDISPLTEMPDGVVEEPESCPIANAMKDIDEVAKARPGKVKVSNREVGQTIAEAWKTSLEFKEIGDIAESIYIVLPETLKVFIDRFDHVGLSDSENSPLYDLVMEE